MMRKKMHFLIVEMAMKVKLHNLVLVFVIIDPLRLCLIFSFLWLMLLTYQLSLMENPSDQIVDSVIVLFFSLLLLGQSILASK